MSSLMDLALPEDFLVTFLYRILENKEYFEGTASYKYYKYHIALVKIMKKYD